MSEYLLISKFNLDSLEQLKRPTMLPCQHTFCLLCLQNYVRANAMSITCPTCRITVAVPSEGVIGLPTNIAMQAFLESLKPQPIDATNLYVKKILLCSRCSSNGTSKSPLSCAHCDEVNNHRRC